MGFFELDGKHQAKAMHYFRPPPPIKGKCDHGIKPSLTFFFDTEKEKQEVYELFREGNSRVPSGRKLLEFVRRFRDDWRTP